MTHTKIKTNQATTEIKENINSQHLCNKFLLWRKIFFYLQTKLSPRYKKKKLKTVSKIQKSQPETNSQPKPKPEPKLPNKNSPFCPKRKSASRLGRVLKCRGTIGRRHKHTKEMNKRVNFSMTVCQIPNEHTTQDSEERMQKNTRATFRKAIEPIKDLKIV